MGYSFPLSARVLLYASFHRQDNTYGVCYTSRGALVGTRSSSMGPPRGIDPTTHRVMSERSYHVATSRPEASLGYNRLCIRCAYYSVSIMQYRIPDSYISIHTHISQYTHIFIRAERKLGLSHFKHQDNQNHTLDTPRHPVTVNKMC